MSAIREGTRADAQTVLPDRRDAKHTLLGKVFFSVQSWRSPSATRDQASGSTLRRCLRRWAAVGLLAKVHALLAAMLRGHPDLILDTARHSSAARLIGTPRKRTISA